MPGDLPYEPAIPLLGIYLEKTIIPKDMSTPEHPAMFTASLFTTARTLKQPECPSAEEWIKKMWCTYTMKYYSTMKKNEIVPFAEMWMDLETVTQNESEKEKYSLFYCIYMESRKTVPMNLFAGHE